MSNEGEEDNSESPKPKTYQSSHFEPPIAFSAVYPGSPATGSSTSGTADYYPSGSAWPWTNEHWTSGEYINFLKSEDTKQVTKLDIEDSEINEIDDFTTKQECHRYRLSKIPELSLLDTYLILFDNILKILPVVLLSSLPLFILANLTINPIAILILIIIYIVLFIILYLSIDKRKDIKSELMKLEQYLVAVIKKEEEIVKNSEDN